MVYVRQNLLLLFNLPCNAINIFKLFILFISLYFNRGRWDLLVILRHQKLLREGPQFENAARSAGEAAEKSQLWGLGGSRGPPLYPSSTS